MHSMPDITFIGGGIAGLLSARLFSLAGANVTIVDKNCIGQESSWAGGGILFPLYPWRQSNAISQLVMSSLQVYPELAHALIETTGIDPECVTSGMLISQLSDLDKARAWCDAHAIEYRSTTQAQQQDFPNISHDSLYLPQVSQVRNPRLLKSLKQDLIQRGVTIIENCAIEKVTLNKGRITEISGCSKTLPITELVITAGAWTGALWAQLFANVVIDKPKVFPVKGQMLIFDTPVKTLETIVLENDHYLIPRRDGKILCGSTVEQGGFDKTLSEEVKQSLSEFARQLCPLLKNAPIIHHWAGLRPGTEQGIPYIDRHPEIENLAINAGHFRNGFAMGPASAQILYELICQQPTTLDATPYKLSAKH